MAVQDREIHELINEIKNSLQQRIEGFREFRREIEGMITCVMEERERLYNDLKEVLAKGRSLRRKDYDSMFQGIRAREEESGAEILASIANFQREEENEPQRLSQFINEGESLEFDTLEPILTGIKMRQEEREMEIRGLLNGFKRENELINDSIHRLVTKGESIRINDFKFMVKNIKEKQERVKEENAHWMEMIVESRRELENEVREMLMNIKAEQDRMREYWKTAVNDMKERLQERTK